MKCRQFEQRLPDWLAERLPANQAVHMETHVATCAACREAMAAERILRRRWQDLPPTPEMPSLWPRIAQRLDRTPQRPRYRLWPALAMGGSMVATLCLVSILFRPHVITAVTRSQAAVQQHLVSTDDTRIVLMASQVQQLPEGESDAFFAETQQDRRELRRVLHGTEEN